MKFLCDSCEKYPCDDNAIKLMKYCPVYSPKPKPQTNADRIRSMTDEELEQWLTAFVCSNVAPHATARGAAKKGRLIEWLREEARHDRTKNKD